MKAYAGITTGSSLEEPKVGGPYDMRQYGITVTETITVYGDREWLEALRDVIDAALRGPA